LAFWHFETVNSSCWTDGWRRTCISSLLDEHNGLGFLQPAAGHSGVVVRTHVVFNNDRCSCTVELYQKLTTRLCIFDPVCLLALREPWETEQKPLTQIRCQFELDKALAEMQELILQVLPPCSSQHMTLPTIVCFMCSMVSMDPREALVTFYRATLESQVVSSTERSRN